tara:strand:+ start:365 stop:553 length:189 start_codon:yes stop_codon:yes gene_type:complete
MKSIGEGEALLREVHFELLGKLSDTYLNNSDHAKGQRQAYLTSILLIKRKIKELRNSNGSRD